MHHDIARVLIELAAGIALVGLAVAVAVVVRALRLPRAKGAMMEVSLRLARWLMAALLAASGIWISASPRAEQPLLDAMERAFPAIRAAYMDEEARNEAKRGLAPSRAARAAARERNRWWIGGVMLALAVSLVVSLPSRRTTPRNFGGERGSTPP